MKIVIEVDMKNDAFEQNPNELRDIMCSQIPSGLKPGDSGSIKDSNGNKVGDWDVYEGY